MPSVYSAALADWNQVRLVDYLECNEFDFHWVLHIFSLESEEAKIYEYVAMNCAVRHIAVGQCSSLWKQLQEVMSTFTA